MNAVARAFETVGLVALGLLIGWCTPARLLLAAMAIVLMLGVGIAITLWRLERRVRQNAPIPRKPSQWREV